MVHRFGLGALLAALITVATGAASAQNTTQKGQICVRNNGGFVLSVKFDFIRSLEEASPIRTVDTGMFPVLQERCTPYYDTDPAVWVNFWVVGGMDKKCMFPLENRSGDLSLVMEGTTLYNNVQCPSW